MALCLADSLLAADGFDVRDQVERYKRWQRDGYLSATGRCLGITASTARALAVAEWRRQLYSGSHAPNQLDPEPLSRVAPVVMFFFAAEQEALQLASDAARTTCQAPAVLGACRDLARGSLPGAVRPADRRSSPWLPPQPRPGSPEQLYPSPRAGEVARTTPRRMRSVIARRRSPRNRRIPRRRVPRGESGRQFGRCGGGMRPACRRPLRRGGDSCPLACLSSGAHADRDLRRPASAALSARDRRVGLGYAVSLQRPAGASQKGLGETDWETDTLPGP